MRAGLYARLALSLAALLCVALLTLGYLLLSEAERRFRAEHLAMAGSQARTLAEGSVDGLVAEDYELLERWVRSVLPADYYAYAFLSRPNGLILTHTELGQVGHRVEAGGRLAGPRVVQRVFKGRPVKEVIHPVRLGDEYLANAHVAYYLDQGSFFSNDMAVKIATVLAVFLVLLLAATLLIIRRHTRPLARLAESITTASLGAASIEGPDQDLLRRRDEVGALAREYQNMLARLRASYEELRNEEQRLRDMVEERTRELRASNRELEAFSYSVSHDLRAPLRAMDGYSRTVLEDHGQVLDDEARHCLQRIRENAGRMGELIDNLLSLSRVSRHDLHTRHVDLSALVRDILRGFQDAEPGRRVDITVEDVPPVRGDPKLLRIMLDNLLGNAWKYTGKTEAAHIEFGVQHDGSETIYHVRDNGVGFDMQYSAKLFGVFERLHRADEFEGEGIGLATVQRIIDRHGGRIWAQSAAGEGAVFYFTLGEPRQ